MIYCYSAHTNGNKVYHDKTCEDVKLIKDRYFRATPVPPEGREPCAKCRRTMYIRQACGNHPKQMKYLQVIFQREKIKTQTIKKFLDKGYSFSTTSLDELHVFCNEDTLMDTPIMILVVHNTLRKRRFTHIFLQRP